jgi:hypothetical protein
MNTRTYRPDFIVVCADCNYRSTRQIESVAILLSRVHRYRFPHRCYVAHTQWATEPQLTHWNACAQIFSLEEWDRLSR